jgi:hypothetical protein
MLHYMDLREEAARSHGDALAKWRGAPSLDASNRGGKARARHHVYERRRKQSSTTTAISET